jgi:4-hydroxy-L-threonine phosphate dehydrogenase PdxA
VWWTQAALKRLTPGQSVAVKYDATVSELNANSLSDWLESFGSRFGWNRTYDLTELQNAANQGQVCVIVAKRKLALDKTTGKLRRKSGHIAVVVPETSSKQAKRKNNIVTIPLQSQAGKSNFRYRNNSVWWKSQQFEKYSFWIHS